MSQCLLCGDDRASLLFRQTDRLYATTGKQFGIVRCDQCGLIRLDPQPPPEELGRYYPETYWFATRPEPGRAIGGDVPQGSAARARPFRSAGAARIEGARSTARRRLRRGGFSSG